MIRQLFELDMRLCYNAQGGTLIIGKDDEGNVETWGRGIEKINELCTKAGLPLPLITNNHSGYWVEFRKDIYNADSLREKD